MKYFIVLCLIALFACECDFIEKMNCLFSQPKLQELGLKIFSYLVTKDYSKILPAILGAIDDIAAAIKECFKV